jgi:hypothetical protein
MLPFGQENTYKSLPFGQEDMDDGVHIILFFAYFVVT